MSIFAVTFRVHWDTEARYNRCYKALIAGIQSQTTSRYWDEPTSFIMIESAKNSAQIADAIVAATPDFDVAEDLVVVINLSVTKGHAVRGKLRDGDFRILIGRR